MTPRIWRAIVGALIGGAITAFLGFQGHDISWWGNADPAMAAARLFGSSLIGIAIGGVIGFSRKTGKLHSDAKAETQIGDTADEPSEVIRDHATTHGEKRSWIARHWRGELSLLTRAIQF